MMKNPTPLLLLLAIVALLSAFSPDTGRKSFGIFINERRLSQDADSVATTEKGILTLHADSPLEGSRVAFRVVIRHRTFGRGILLFPWDEEYKPEAYFDVLELQKILPKTMPGDQLIILSRDSSGAPDSFVVTVARDGC